MEAPRKQKLDMINDILVREDRAQAEGLLLEFTQQHIYHPVTG